MINPDDATPLIICGRQRAGTRFVANLLSSFDEVTLQGEIPNPVMRAAKAFLDSSDAFYDQQAVQDEDPRRLRQRKLWYAKRKRLMFDIWGGASQAPRTEPGPNCRYFGYKRPNNEIFFGFYEELFAEPKAHYVFCVRNFEDNYLSIVSRWPDRRVDTVAEDYLASLAQYQIMKSAAPERVHLFNLDAHIRDGAPYVHRTVLEPLGLCPRDAKHARQIEEAGPVNTTEGTAKRPRRRELTADEAAFLKSRPDIASAYDRAIEKGAR